MALPTMRDVMRGSRVGSFAAKYDSKDGFFFHVKIAPEFADLVGFRMPVSGEGARYRVLVFGSIKVLTISLLWLYERAAENGYAHGGGRG